MRTAWYTLVVVDEDAGVVHDESRRRILLDQLRSKGSMENAYLTRTWLRHEVANDRRTWGPNRREIDWGGFTLDGPTPRPPPEA